MKIILSLILLILTISFVKSENVRINNIKNYNNNKYNNKYNNKVSSSSTNDDSSFEPSNNPFIVQYNAQRGQLVGAEDKLKVGYYTNFNQKENQANGIFSSILQEEQLKYSNVDPAAVNFFAEKEFIDNNSVIFKIIQKMPKGSALHIHQDSSATYDYLVYNGTYLPNCYIYIVKENDNDPSILSQNGTFYFFKNTPTDPRWNLLSDLRAKSNNVSSFDQTLYTSLTLINEDYGSYEQLWDKFDGIFARVSGLVNYIPITVGYMTHLFQQTVQDNIQHIELRKTLGTNFYDLQGNTYDDVWFLNVTQQLLAEFKTKNNMPEFGLKIVGCDPRHTSNQSLILDHMYFALDMVNKYPDFFVGYDLVGPEDNGYSLLYFIDQFAEINEESLKRKYPLNYYFHAGETILYNNTNLYDAVLLKTKRIGHGLQLTKHPLLMEAVLKDNIGIEVCPISNQVLGFVSDMRTHPAFDLLEQGFPLTISPDDPAIYNYYGLSYDFFEVTYGWGLDLKQLKQLCINSIQQSSLFDQNEYNTLYQAWENKWFEFIDFIINNFDQKNN
ncbi:hypothetical protein DICPUDRAFT_48090 [Dictyostelium purpureum]|uniref:adenosine deaminase n=1 Tax=Dictyostelium purpureum TaxID=5786 RepID=F0ZMR4_DICPU|nr:uncharacterized protein DICPUDRAFT_48090 [Dictyostelium purpureum]EGC34793.1 hypothetical protein DICPUDRAFT_48090 [Dictyostelium purpureum]|eukprot:XP_003288708.1 hypothetical protein DICPUDRAFT_48090 [Dictyostelium purpureum]